MRREDAIRIDHMIEADEACASFMAGRSRDEFEADLMLRFALARATEIIGEAGSRLSIEARRGAIHPAPRDRGDPEPADPCLFRLRP
jgi:uncharacterized protein with HEPN domain